jgi:adenine deaminase
LIDTFSEEKAQALYAKFVKNGTYIAPSFLREWGGLKQRSMTEPRLAFTSAALQAETQAQVKNFRPQNVAANQMIHQAHYRIVKEMQRAGVKLLAGTDGRLFGFDLHDELEELVTAGLTPMQALQTATKNAADYFGKLDSMGTVEKGKVADLVLLDANPLDSIANATKINAVVVNGLLLDRKALDRMEAQMKAGIRTARPAIGFGDVK